jgi:hypothetical protein
MDFICEGSFLVAIIIAYSISRKLIPWGYTKLKELPDVGLHITLLALSVSSSLLSSAILIKFSEGGLWFCAGFLLILGIPLTFLSESVVELLQNTPSINFPSLDLWVPGLLLCIQWIIWGQVIAAIIRITREDGHGIDLLRGSQIKRENLPGGDLLWGSHTTPENVRLRNMIIFGVIAFLVVCILLCRLISR